MNPSRNVILFGTEEPVAETIRLEAGPLTAELEAGALRYIRLNGVEVIRGIAFLARDRNWGTCLPEITGLEVEQGAEGFSARYEATCRDGAGSIRYRARIVGRPDGSLDFEAEGEALDDFTTNRTGFVVLHPLAGTVGAPLTVEHVDGRVVESRFPEMIDPDCPFRDIRALTHEPIPGLRLTCRMEGDAFEMEDHRNWMDASWKTYVRPLALPWPYVLAKGEALKQRVTLRLSGALAAPALAAGGGAIPVKVGAALPHALPRLGLAAPAEHVAAALERAGALRALGPAHLVCRFDARKGNGAEDMARFAALGRETGAELVLEAVVPCEDASGAPTADPAILKRDLAFIAEAARAGGAAFARVAISPASDLKCTLPGSVFPPAPAWETLFAEGRAAFPGVTLGGGMFSYFTELNRKRPPAALLDFICHSGCPIVHAGDDLSVTENLEALPSIFSSARALAGGKPYWIFPASIAMRDNPYGAVPAENPNNIRQAMNRVDPRERGLLGAAWYAGYLAHAARAGVEAVTLAAIAGPSGVIHVPGPEASPWMDAAGAALRPSWHVLAAYAALRGVPLSAESGAPRTVQALAAEGEGGARLILANLTGEPVDIALSGAAGPMEAVLLDEGAFAAAVAGTGWRDAAPRVAVEGGKLALGAHAVAFVAPA